MKQKHYIDIQNIREEDTELRSGNTSSFHVGDIVQVTEKIDGANAMAAYDAEEDKMFAFSRKQELTYSNTLNGFWNFIQNLPEHVLAQFKAHPEYRVFGEWCAVKNKIVYDKEKISKNPWYLFDIYDAEQEKWLTQDIVRDFAKRCGFEYIHELYNGPFQDWKHIRSFMHSPAYGDRQEGVVCKNQTMLNRLLEGDLLMSDTDKSHNPLYLKIVNDDFKESKRTREKVPGSGKSTYCKSHPEYVHISSDALRKEMGFDAGKGNDVVFTEMMVRTKEHLGKGQDVIWDSTSLMRKHRMETLISLNKYNVSKHCICFTEPFDVCVRRNNGRTGFDKVPENVIYNMAKNFTVPNEYEGFNDVRFIQTVEGIDPAKYLKMAEDFDQDNPHHDMTLYEHMNATYECACELLKESSLSEHMKENVRLAAQYHDIGKLYTKDYHDNKGNETDIAHYYQHENVGAYMYLSSAAKCESKKVVSTLINWHMRPYLKDMSEKKRETERTMLGEEFCTMLDILYEADVNSHFKHTEEGKSI